jgi:DNA-binding GntR family transcriptional regulator
MLDDDLQITGQVVTVRALVEERLRTAIVTGRFQPGQRLPERELCELTGAARTSVREALRQLESEGLVATVPHRGPSVSVITPEEARELYELRAVLEGHAGRRCAERGSPAHHAALDEAVRKTERAAAAGDGRGVMGASAAIYEALMDGAGNATARQMLDVLHNRLALLRFGSVHQPGRMRGSAAELRAIADAVLARDGGAAERACIRHIEAAAELALRVLAERAAPPISIRRSAGENP